MTLIIIIIVAKLRLESIALFLLPVCSILFPFTPRCEALSLDHSDQFQRLIIHDDRGLP